MTDPQIRFSDGASYDVMMGSWSRGVGEIFLDWMQQPAGLDWIDLGCGSGAFTGLVVERCAPRTILGIDPSESQLDFARKRGIANTASFAIGDAMALDAPDGTFDVAASALVLHFMPDPASGVAEMARVTKPGGVVGSYAWDLSDGGFPYEAVHVGMRALGSPPPQPPHPEAAEATELRRLWLGAGLNFLAQREILVTRRFRDFDDYWRTATTSPRIAAVLTRMPDDAQIALREAVRSAVPVNSDGSVVPTARANAIVGRVPK